MLVLDPYTTFFKYEIYIFAKEITLFEEFLFCFVFVKECLAHTLFLEPVWLNL